jgi:hypothetical protein
MLSQMKAEVIDAGTATEFWGLLCPEKPLFKAPCKLLYRGQANQEWNLTPSILRKDIVTRSDMQVFKEWAYIDSFVSHCDSIGLPIPSDSQAFRAKFINQNSPAGPGGAFIHTAAWPPQEMYDLIALAQHYRLPTRLLDWSTRSYVAAYFAISDALAKASHSDAPERLAVWVLNIESKSLFPKLRVIKVPGSNNVNLAAQAGQFTLLEQEGIRGAPFQGDIALDSYFEGLPLPSPLLKVTLPAAEASAALKLSALYGVTGATLFPDYHGAVRGTNDIMSSAHLL